MQLSTSRRAAIALRLRLSRSASWQNEEVLSISTDSRDVAETVRARKLEECASQLRGVSIGILFKKIDSTLRGDPGSEIRMARDAFGCDAAIVTPAYPAMGRLVEGGVLRVSGQADFEPVQLAEFFGGDCGHAAIEQLRTALEGGAKLSSP